MSKEKEPPPTKEDTLKALQEEFRGNDATTQRARLREAFHRCLALTTLEIRRWLDILHPAGRVKELRAEGLDIITLRQDQATEAGVRHAVGKYVYRPRNAHGVES